MDMRERVADFVERRIWVVEGDRAYPDKSALPAERVRNE